MIQATHPNVCAAGMVCVKFDTSPHPSIASGLKHIADWKEWGMIRH
jgi:hypothetical protein